MNYNLCSTDGYLRLLGYIGEDLMWACSIKRCWYYSLWFKARKYSFMHEVSRGDKVLFFPFLFKFSPLHAYTSLLIFVFHCFLGNSNSKPAEVKIIDFGSACMEDRTVYSYIQVIRGLHFIFNILKMISVSYTSSSCAEPLLQISRSAAWISVSFQMELLCTYSSLEASI